MDGRMIAPSHKSRSQTPGVWCDRTVCGHTPSQDRYAGFCERLLWGIATARRTFIRRAVAGCFSVVLA